MVKMKSKELIGMIGLISVLWFTAGMFYGGGKHNDGFEEGKKYIIDSLQNSQQMEDVLEDLHIFRFEEI